MHNVVGVRFQEAGKIYYFSPVGFEDIEVGEFVVVETSRGLEIARVVIAPHQVVNAELTETLKPLVRAAFQEDIEQMERLKARADSDVAVARRIALRLDLPLKIVSAAYNLDGTRLTIYFNPTGESRVDLRDLLRELQAELNVAVQLRQVGPRDQAKAVGGYGICGRRLCCSAWLTAFPAISIKMAKEQNQPLNPNKISGQCGRLLCCLSYENDMYKQLKAELPRVGTIVSTPAGDARVVGVNALRQVVTLQMHDFQMVEMPASALAMERGVVRVVQQPESAPEPQHEEAIAAAIAARPPRPERERPADGGGRGPGRREGPARRDREERRPPSPLPAGAQTIEQRHESVLAGEPVPESADQAARRKRRRRRGGRGRGPGDDRGPAGGDSGIVSPRT
jgi:cell fate regulator YaaT (PSP1 superfamily)